MKNIINDKDFYVIKIEKPILSQLGMPGICDSCNNTPEEGYYIAVLNRWYCQTCYDEWYQRANNYPEDREYEKKNAARMELALNCVLLKGVQNLLTTISNSKSGDYKQILVQKTEKAGLIFSTINTPDLGYETAIKDKNKIYVVERYKTKDDAINGHIAWVLKAEDLDVITEIGMFGEKYKVKLERNF